MLNFSDPLTDEVIRAAVRENARIAAVQSGPTVPDARAVANYHRVRTVLLGLALGGAEHPLLRQNDQPGSVTAEEIAAIERLREEILRADPQLTQMLSRIEARRRSSPVTPPPESPVTARPAIGYVTPKGKPHAFRVKTVVQVWDRIERFLRGCTDADPLRPAGASLMFSETAAALERPAVAAALERARAVLGPSQPAAWAGLGVILPELPAPSLEPLFTGGVQHLWNLTADQVEAALQLMLAGDPWPPALVPIALLTMLHRFRWTGTGRASDAGQVSTCVAQLGSRSFLTPIFYFPFESADERFLAYLHHIKGLVPFPLSPKNFRLFQPTERTGTLVPRLFDTSAIAEVLEH